MANARVPTCPAGATAVLVASESASAITQSAAHRHIGRVSDRFNDTPDDVGLLTAPLAEGEVAAPHVGAAGSDDLAGIHRHITHELHAIARSTLEREPGNGYGIATASTSCAGHRRTAGSALGTVIEAGAPTNILLRDMVVNRTVHEQGDQVIEEEIAPSWHGSKPGRPTTEGEGACLRGGL